MASNLPSGETNRNESDSGPLVTSLEVLSSIRYDQLLIQSPHNTQLSCNESSPFYMLRYHRDRMVAAVHELGWPEARIVLEGQGGIVRLQQALQDHLADSHNPAHVPQPRKVLFIST